MYSSIFVSPQLPFTEDGVDFLVRLPPFPVLVCRQVTSHPVLCSAGGQTQRLLHPLYQLSHITRPLCIWYFVLEHFAQVLFPHFSLDDFHFSHIPLVSYLQIYIVSVFILYDVVSKRFLMHITWGYPKNILVPPAGSGVEFLAARFLFSSFQRWAEERPLSVSLQKCWLKTTSGELELWPITI